MHTVTLAEAKEQLDALVAEVGRGEEIVITRDDQPVARLTPASAAEEDKLPDRFPLFGLLEGGIIFHEGWDEPLEDFKPYTEK